MKAVPGCSGASFLNLQADAAPGRVEVQDLKGAQLLLKPPQVVLGGGSSRGPYCFLLVFLHSSPELES